MLYVTTNFIFVFVCVGGLLLFVVQFGLRVGDLFGIRRCSYVVSFFITSIMIFFAFCVNFGIILDFMVLLVFILASSTSAFSAS